MRKVKLDNDDLIQYLNTIKALKKYPTMSEYRGISQDKNRWLTLD
jgi:hypothetical protein